MKYIPLQRQPWKLYEIHTLTGKTGEPIPLQGQPCNLYEIHTLTGTTL